MTWLGHAMELRNRLFKVSIAIFLGMLVGFFLIQYRDYAILRYVIEYFTFGKGLQTDDVTESFTNIVQIALGIGFAFAMPVLVYQIMAFIVPGLTVRERRILFLTLPLIILCFIGGLAFGWFVTLPAAFKWLLGIGPDIIENQPTFDGFTSFFLRLMLANGVVFELPLIVYSVIWLGAVERATLAKFRRYAVLVIVIVSAMITPTADPVNLALVAVPMYLLYELGLLLALIAPRRRPPPALAP